MTLTKKLIGFTLVNILVLYLTNLLFPKYLVFGNMLISYWQALITAAFGITIAHVLFEPIAEEFKFFFHKHNWPTVFFLVNAGIIYLLARTPMSKSVGIGIVAFWMALALSIVVTGAQYLFWKFVTKK